MESLRDDLRIDPHELAALRAYDLGTLDGVPVTFSDATPVAQELLVFTASAEGEGGAIRGSLVGTLDRDGRGPAAADDRPPLQGRGRARHDRHRRHGLPLRVRPGRPGHAVAAARRRPCPSTARSSATD